MKSGGRYNAHHFGRVLARLEQLGIVTLLDKRTGLRRIEPRDHDWIAQLEKRLGVAGARDENIRDARKESGDYLDWLLSDLRRHGDEDAALAAWDAAPPGAPAGGRDNGEGRAVPRFLQNWGGLPATRMSQ